MPGTESKRVKLERSENTATVAELIRALQQFPPEAPVYTEGCDCIGNTVAVSIDHDGDVLIERDN